jgi:hypothetical protein
MYGYKVECFEGFGAIYSMPKIDLEVGLQTNYSFDIFRLITSPINKDPNTFYSQKNKKRTEP